MVPPHRNSHRPQTQRDSLFTHFVNGTKFWYSMLVLWFSKMCQKCNKMQKRQSTGYRACGSLCRSNPLIKNALPADSVWKSVPLVNGTIFSYSMLVLWCSKQCKKCNTKQQPYKNPAKFFQKAKLISYHCSMFIDFYVGKRKWCGELERMNVIMIEGKRIKST